jgi:hypothetical protein
MIASVQIFFLNITTHDLMNNNNKDNTQFQRFVQKLNHTGKLTDEQVTIVSNLVEANGKDTKKAFTYIWDHGVTSQERLQLERHVNVLLRRMDPSSTLLQFHDNLNKLTNIEQLYVFAAMESYLV